MRNYVKVRAVAMLRDDMGYDFAFGGDDDNLGYWIRFVQDQQGGNYVTVFEPQTIWFELNRNNLVHLLNLREGRSWFWINSRLNQLFPDHDNFQWLWDMTRVQQQGSPRPTWSHGH